MAKVANSRIASEITGIVCPVDFAAMANDQARVQFIIDLISSESPDGTDLQARQYLDQMSPMCRNSLIVMLTKARAAIT